MKTVWRLMIPVETPPLQKVLLSSPAKLHACCPLRKKNINDLHVLLKSTEEGKTVLAFYNLKGKLNGQFRDILASRVVYGEFKPPNRDKRITLKRLLELADLIVELFPTECQKTWCEVVKKKNRNIVQGRLRHRYFNIRRMFISVGLIPKSKIADELDCDEDLSDGECEDDNILWLNSHDSPWKDVLTKWADSHGVRKNIFRKCKHIGDIIDQFPALKKPFGPELLVQDFNAEHPGLELAVQVRWPKFISYLQELLQEKDPEFLANQDELNDASIVEILTNCAKVFKPRTHPKISADTQKGSNSKGSKKSTEKGKGKASNDKKANKRWRPSSSEVQEAFVIRIDEIGALKDVIESRRKILLKFGYSLQPFIVLVGSAANIRQCIIVLDQLLSNCPSPLEAVETCFKIFFQLNCNYPVEARHIWLIIQQCVYGITTIRDFHDAPGLSSFIASYVKDLSVL